MIDYTLYVPTTLNDGTLVASDYIEHTIKTIATHYGGATVDHAQGYYTMDDGKLSVDLIDRINVIADGKDLFMPSLARTIATDLCQESVLLTDSVIDAQFVTSTPDAIKVAS